MFDILFNNIGKKIKTTAKVIFAFFMACGCLAALVFIVLSFGRRNPGWLFFVGLAFVPAAFIVAWLFSILIYGFGELIESSVTTMGVTSKIDRQIRTLTIPYPAPSAEPAEQPTQPSSPATAATQTSSVTNAPQGQTSPPAAASALSDSKPKVEARADGIHVSKTNLGVIICPSCKQLYTYGEKKCEKCRKPFIYDL